MKDKQNLFSFQKLVFVPNKYSSGVCSKIPRYQVGTVSAYTPILQPAAVLFNTLHVIPHTGGISLFVSLFVSFFCFSETEIAKNHGMKSVLF